MGCFGAVRKRRRVAGDRLLRTGSTAVRDQAAPLAGFGADPRRRPIPISSPSTSR